MDQKRNNFIKTRAQATQEVQARIAESWTWDQKTIAQWQTDIVALEKIMGDEGGKRLAWYMAREAFRNDLDRIADVTWTLKREGPMKFRHQHAIANEFYHLSNRFRKPRKVYEQGLVARELWTRSDPAWTPRPGMTLADFGAVLEAFPDREQADQATQAAWWPALSALNKQIHRLDADNQAWYAAATERFAPGTAEGDLIRSSVPIAPPVDLPQVEQAAISNLKVTGNAIQFDCAAAGATHYTYLHQAPGSPLFTVLLAETTETHVTLKGLAPGLHHFKAFGNNASMTGLQSLAAPVTVGAAAKGQETNPGAAENDH